MKRTTLLRAAASILLVGARSSTSAPRHAGTCSPSLETMAASRNLPYQFLDQGLESLRALYPEHRLLLARRDGHLGRVEYSLLVYQETPAADSAQIAGAAVVGDRAWSVAATCPMSELPEGLVATMEAIAALPRLSEPPAPP